MKHTTFHMADVERVKRHMGFGNWTLSWAAHMMAPEISTRKAYDELKWQSTPRDLVEWCRRHMEQPIQERSRRCAAEGFAGWVAVAPPFPA